MLRDRYGPAEYGYVLRGKIGDLHSMGMCCGAVYGLAVYWYALRGRIWTCSIWIYMLRDSIWICSVSVCAEGQYIDLLSMGMYSEAIYGPRVSVMCSGNLILYKLINIRT